MISTVADFRKELSGRRAAEMIRDGFEVAIVGPPNAGKSSLLNALAGRDVAITSSVAGTTRDVIEVRMDINGFAVTVLDTAGLRETNDAVESLGVDLARRRADAADLRVFLIERREDMAGLGVEPRGQDLVIYSKSDLLGHSGAMSVSTVTGNGISALIASVGAILEERVSGASTLIRQRHADALNAAADDISTAASMMAEGLGELDLVAELVRHATGQVDMLTGRIGVEDVLGEIFSRFCIGK